MLQLAVLAACATVSLGGCQDKPAAQRMAKPLDKSERIERAKRILKPMTPPSEILDAQFDERAVGKPGGLGPTDFVSYTYLNVGPEHIGKWTALLKEQRDEPPVFEMPDGAYLWWIDAERFEKLRFFAPAPLSLRQGWVGVSEETGEIWMADFTT